MDITTVYIYLSVPIEEEYHYDWNEIPIVVHEPNQPPFKKFNHSSGRRKYTKFARNNNTESKTNGFARNTKTNWRESRYASVFKKENQTANDVLMDSIKDSLNKVSSANFDKSITFIGDKLERLDDTYIPRFVEEVFSRAAGQTIFCKMYVDILKRTIDIKPLIVENITKIIEAYLSIFNTKITKKEIEDYDEFCENNKQKKFRTGYSSFLSELYHCGLINKELVLTFANTILTNVNDDLEKETTPDLKESIQDNVMCFKCLVERVSDNIDNNEQYIEMGQHIQNILKLGRPVLKVKMGFKSIFALEDMSKLLP